MLICTQFVNNAADYDVEDIPKIEGQIFSTMLHVESNASSKNYIVPKSESMDGVPDLAATVSSSWVVEASSSSSLNK